MKIKLSKVYEAGSERFAHVELREPTYLDYRQIGRPFDVQRGVVIRDRDATFAYVDRLCTSPATGALAVLNLADSMSLEEAVLAFFTDAMRSKAGLESSSSASAGSPDTSTD
ncbi:phage tail assembly protein [Aureimonas altamirensis]|uniref:phage tail assembly protein n=1 Tax=Aureimonas altamirensis TaxID=370622 RepID=UPI001E58DBBE|nr:phage tail assembly protein [Aureimonas altamirensis]UHD45534.1 phage tail assembly protein [Aureimonas altamirensis]